MNVFLDNADIDRGLRMDHPQDPVIIEDEEQGAQVGERNSDEQVNNDSLSYALLGKFLKRLA